MKRPFVGVGNGGRESNKKLDEFIRPYIGLDISVTSAAPVASRSSRSCFNTSLVTMATISAVLPAASGTTSDAVGKSSGRPAAAATGRRRRMGGAGAGALTRRRTSLLLGGGTAVSPWFW